MKKIVYSKNWLKKVKNYYNGLSYVMENKLKLTPHIEDVFLKDLVEFYNKLFLLISSLFGFLLNIFVKVKLCQRL